MEWVAPASYALNLHALPVLACAPLVVALGLFMLARERGSPVGVVYFLLMLAIGAWFVGIGVGYLALEVETARPWHRLAHVGVSFIPALALHFAWSFARPDARRRWQLAAVWAGSGAFAVLGAASSWYYGEPHRYPWGLYPGFTVYGVAFLVFFAATFVRLFSLLRRAGRGLHRTVTAIRRARLLAMAFAVGCLGSVDFVPGYGVAIYPFGYVPVAVSVVIATYIIVRYRLLDVTAELAARQILETINDGLFVLDQDGYIRVVNDTLLEIIGEPREALIGRRIPRALRQLLTPAELASIRAGVPMHNREIEYRRRDGTLLTLSFAMSVLRTGTSDPVAYVCVLRDISEQKRTESRIRFLAYYDNLTSLPNRQQFEEQVRRALVRAAHAQRMVALLFLDIDHFKRVNDTLGHMHGDALLQAIAGRLVGCIRKARPGAPEDSAVIARLGGDEFIAALYDLESQDDAARVAERVLAAVSEPVRLDAHEVSVTASLGISIYPYDGNDVEALMKHADAAMYQAKEAGRNSFFFYDRAMNATMLNRLAIEARLRKALENGSLSLHYQPQLALHDNEVQGVEALLRWNDPELGTVAPESFIPIAEDTGLILPIGEWVLRTACAQARAWLDAGIPLGRIAVNISGRQFRDRDLVARVRAALAAARLEPRYLELELTESVVMQDALHTRRTLAALKAMGVHLSIDDFGTGYSSLSYLRSFPIDTLKIDRSFVRDIAADADTEAIVSAIIAMARSLKLGVVGEGVETEAQRAFLLAHGCKRVQGFLYCEPLPPSELESWLRAQAMRAAP
ncbi:MAG TPA: EAL domain-containing protein [Burkholderiales bacterium]